jgi:hypothetical protein
LSPDATAVYAPSFMGHFRFIHTGMLVLLLAGAMSCAKGTRGTSPPVLPQPSRELELPDKGLMKVYDNGLTLFVLPDA